MCGDIQVAGPTPHCVIPADGIVVARPNKIALDVTAVSRGSTSNIVTEVQGRNIRDSGLTPVLKPFITDIPTSHAHGNRHGYAVNQVSQNTVCGEYNLHGKPACSS